MTGGRRIRPVLTPTGHPTEHQLRVALATHVGSDSEPLHDAGTEPFDQRIGLLDEVEQCGDAVGMFEVDRDVAPTAPQDVGVGSVGSRPADGAGPLDPDDLGAHVGQEHRRERPGADTGDLDDAVAGERTAHDVTAISAEAAAATSP